MSENKLDLLKCDRDLSIVDAMKMINKNTHGLVFVVDKNDTLLGCLADGNVRRWIINGGSLEVSVSDAMNPEPIYVKDKERNKATGLMSEYHIRSVAVVDDDKRLIDVVVADPGLLPNKRVNTLSDIPVIVMAGGKGTRLYPYTKILPKPLVPIGDIPILERILNRFAKYGVDEFYITVNYRKEMIKSYFAESPHDFTVHFVEENKPLGTVGSIKLIKRDFNTPLFISNCDILIEADYGDIMEHHIKFKNDFTIVSALKNTVIPYGVLHTKKDGVVTSVVEKPELSHFVNTGMYIMNPEFIDWIPDEKVFHMTELVDLMISKGKRVGMYPVNEYSFLDMGEMAELKKMEERINAEFNE